MGKSVEKQQNRGGDSPLWEKKYLLAAALLVVIYWQTGKYLYRAYTLVDSYYSHGFLVPFISGYFVWRLRKKVAAIPGEPSLSGLAWMVAAGLLLLVGDFLGFRVLGQFSIIPMLAGICIAFQGKKRTAALWFPLAFLIFMVPIPASLTQSVALQLKLFAAQCSVALANLLTLPMVREGSFIYFGDDHLLIGDVCGGLRSLIALLAFGSLMAYISKTKPWARILVLAMAGPIAVLANVFRIFLLCVVGYFWGSDIAAGTVHDVSGYLIFVVAFILFLALESLLRRWAPAEAAGAEAAGAASVVVEDGLSTRGQAGKRGWGAFAKVIVVLALVGATHWAVAAAQDRAARNVPNIESIDIPYQIVDYTRWGADPKVDERTKQILETSTILVRNYRAPSGMPVQLTVVYAGATRRSLHFPEVCLVGEGYEIREQSTAQVSFLFSAKRLVLVKGQSQEAVLYWFKTGDYSTGSFFLNTLYWAKNQLLFGSPTSAMIRLSAPIGAGGPEESFRILEDFAVKVAPILRERVI